MRYTKVGAAVVGALASATLLAPAAQANTNDAAYLSQLLGEGLSFSSADYVIGLGHAICTDLGNGVNPIAEANLLPGVEALGGWNLSFFEAGFIVGTAQKYYCPEIKGEGV